MAFPVFQFLITLWAIIIYKSCVLSSCFTLWSQEFVKWFSRHQFPPLSIKKSRNGLQTSDCLLLWHEWLMPTPFWSLNLWVVNAVRIPRVNTSRCRPRTLKYTTENNTYTITRYFFSLLFCTIYFHLSVMVGVCVGCSRSCMGGGGTQIHPTERCRWGIDRENDCNILMSSWEVVWSELIWLNLPF